MGPYESLAYFAEKERGEQTRRQIAQQFNEFRRLNPEASAEDLRDFLSMSAGGSPYTPYQLQRSSYIDRIAKQNAEAKAKRLLDEQYKSQLDRAKQAEALRGMYRQYLTMYGGDEKRAMSEVERQFTGGVNDPNANAMIKQTLGLIDPQAEKGLWLADVRNKDMERAKDMIVSGMSLEQVFAGVNPALQGDPQITALWKMNDDKRKRDEDDRNYRDQQRNLQAEQQAQAAKDKKRATAQAIAKDLATGVAPAIVKSTYADELMDPEVVQMVQDFNNANYNAMNTEAEKTLPDKIKAVGDQQIAAANIDMLTGYAKKSDPYAGRPYVQAAAKTFASQYLLNSGQIARLQDYLARGKIKGETTSDVMSELRKFVFNNGSEDIRFVETSVKNDVRGEMKMKRPSTWQEAIEQKKTVVRGEMDELKLQLEDASATGQVAAMQGMLKDIDLMIADVKNKFPLVTSSVFMDTTAAGDGAKEGAAMVAELEQLKAQVRAELAKFASNADGKLSGHDAKGRPMGANMGTLPDNAPFAKPVNAMGRIPSALIDPLVRAYTKPIRNAAERPKSDQPWYEKYIDGK